MNDNNWIPTSSGSYPKDMTDVQVTYIGCKDNKPHCDAFAYRIKDKWYWALSDVEAVAKITAWRPSGEPYTEKRQHIITITITTDAENNEISDIITKALNNTPVKIDSITVH